MSVEEKISRLRRFISENPALKYVPFILVRGRAVTPEEALRYLEAGQYVSEIMEGLRTLGLDPDWELVEEFYRRMVAAHPEVKIYALAEYVPVMTPSEALMHIRARDEVGETLRRAYSRLLEYMRVRVDW